MGLLFTDGVKMTTISNILDKKARIQELLETNEYDPNPSLYVVKGTSDVLGFYVSTQKAGDLDDELTEIAEELENILEIEVTVRLSKDKLTAPSGSPYKDGIQPIKLDDETNLKEKLGNVEFKATPNGMAFGR